MKAFVYILQSQLGKYYVGSTTDVERRVKQHQAGHTHSTKRLGSVKLVFSQEVENLTEARRIEAKIKAWKRKDFVEKIIQDGRIKIVD